MGARVSGAAAPPPDPHGDTKRKKKRRGDPAPQSPRRSPRSPQRIHSPRDRRASSADRPPVQAAPCRRASPTSAGDPAPQSPSRSPQSRQMIRSPRDRRGSSADRPPEQAAPGRRSLPQSAGHRPANAALRITSESSGPASSGECDTASEVQPVRESSWKDGGSYGATRTSPSLQHQRSQGDVRSDMLRSSSVVLLTHEASTLVRERFEYPSARDMTLAHMGTSLGYCGYMLTSWLVVSIQHPYLWPSCSALWGGLWSPGSIGCSAAILVYWLFPLLCCFVNLIFNYQDLLRTRLYYEMFAHRVNLDYANVSFWRAPSVWTMIVVAFLSCGIYPMTDKLSLHGVLVTLPYWTPLLAFASLLYQMWDIESRLLSVAKFVERDLEWASTHMKESYFITDFVAEAAFHNVVSDLKEQVPAPILTTGEFVLEIAAEAERMDATDEDLERMSKSASTTLLHTISGKYWVRGFLWSPYLGDPEAQNFHFWFSLYFLYTIVVVILLLIILTLTVVTHLRQQSVLGDSWLTQWLNLDYFSVVAVTSMPGGSSQPAGAAAKSSTQGRFQKLVERHGTRGLIFAGVAVAWAVIFCVASFIVYRWHSQLKAGKRHRPTYGLRTFLCACCCTWLACCLPIDEGEREALDPGSDSESSSALRKATSMRFASSGRRPSVLFSQQQMGHFDQQP